MQAKYSTKRTGIICIQPYSRLYMTHVNNVTVCGLVHDVNNVIVTVAHMIFFLCVCIISLCEHVIQQPLPDRPLLLSNVMFVVCSACMRIELQY